MLKIQQLQKNYKSFSLNCSLEVCPGRITGLIGQNGAGKSTTFKAILGLLKPEGGSITLLGKTISQFTAKDREKLGVVLSNAGFSGYLTVRDLLPILKNLYSAFDEAFFKERLQTFGLPLDKKIKDFSTGMKAKLKVLAAISHNAELLILDEPTAGLDVIARDGVLLLLREFMEQNEHRAILISSHISSDLEGLCDDLYMIHNGQIVLHEETHVLLDEYAVLKADPTQYEALDKQYLRSVCKEAYGFACLTDQRQYYLENAPQVILEKATIDSVMNLIIKGEKI